MAASVLMAGALKFEGRLSLQFEGPGPIQLMLAQCTHRHAIRGVARHDECRRTHAGGRPLRRRPARRDDRADGRRRALPGRRAARDGAARRLPRAVFRALRAAPSRLMLAATPDRAAGLLLQRVAMGEAGTASGRAEADDAWRRLGLLAATVSPKELFDLPSRELLRRLFPRTTSACSRARRSSSSAPAHASASPGSCRRSAGPRSMRCSPSGATSRCAANSATAPGASTRSTSRRFSRRERRNQRRGTALAAHRRRQRCEKPAGSDASRRTATADAR